MLFNSIKSIKDSFSPLDDMLFNHKELIYDCLRKQFLQLQNNVDHSQGTKQFEHKVS
jgi:hypothetical protein